MTISELINNFAVHLKQYGLNGDNHQQELYKWEIISKYHDRLDADSSDFVKNVSEMNFLNLWYSLPLMTSESISHKQIDRGL